MMLELERMQQRLAGDRVLRRGGYRVERRIGQGGMCSVFEVVNDARGQRHALKVLTPSCAGDPELVARFRNEARALARMRHPGLVHVEDLGALADGTPYMLLELLRGETLAQRLVRGPLPQTEALRVAAQLADALCEVHRAGIVHRDLKPGNVMLCRDERGELQVKLVDFGVAKLLDQGDLPSGETAVCTVVGMLMGTPAYMSPEQICGSATVDAQTDVYALGALLFVMLTGRAPFNAPSIDKLLELQVRAPTPPLRAWCPAADPEVADLVHAMMEKEPAVRPTMPQVARRLRVMLSAAPADDGAEVLIEAAPDAETLSSLPRLAAPEPTTRPTGSTTGPTRDATIESPPRGRAWWRWRSLALTSAALVLALLALLG